MSREERLITIAIWLIAAFNIGLILGLVYVAVHFLLKAW